MKPRLSLIAAALAALASPAMAEQVLRIGNDIGFGAATTMDPYDGSRDWPAINLGHLDF